MHVEELYYKFHPLTPLKQKILLLNLGYLPEEYSLCNSYRSFQNLVDSLEGKRFSKEDLKNDMQILFLGNTVDRDEIYKIVNDEQIDNFIYDGMQTNEFVEELLK